MRITVAGSGIGGLAAALSLHAAGFTDVTVMEAAPEIRPLGFGLNILPNAVRELTALGLLEELRRQAVRTRELALYTPRGSLVWREDRGLAAGYGWPQIAVSRSRLVEVLVRAVRHRLGDGAIVTGARLVGLGDGPGGASGVFEAPDGSRRTVQSDVLVGADGIHSAVRAAFHPDEGPPRTNGITLHRGTAWSEPFLSGSSMAVLGDDTSRLVMYPIERDRSTGRVLVNWVAAFPCADDAPRTLPGDTAGMRRTVLRHLGGWSPPGTDLARLLADTPRIHRYAMTDRDPLPRWTFGGVTLLGDAAHAMYPAGSNGATQAVLDARVLAWHLAGRDDPRAALEAYEAERRPQMTELQRSNRAMGPERVLTLAHRRAPAGFGDVSEVFAEGELEEISRGYAETGRFGKEWVNSRPSLSVVPPGGRPAGPHDDGSAV